MYKTFIPEGIDLATQYALLNLMRKHHLTLRSIAHYTLHSVWAKLSDKRRTGLTLFFIDLHDSGLHTEFQSCLCQFRNAHKIAKFGSAARIYTIPVNQSDSLDAPCSPDSPCATDSNA